MAVPFTELEIATRRHFMPVVMNQIWKVSPVLYRIFRPSKAGSWGLALPKLKNWAIKIYFDMGNPEIGNPSQAYRYEKR